MYLLEFRNKDIPLSVDGKLFQISEMCASSAPWIPSTVLEVERSAVSILGNRAIAISSV